MAMQFKRKWDFDQGNKPVLLNDMTQDREVIAVLQAAIAVAARGEDGEDGRGIDSVVKVSGDGTPGSTDTYRMTFTDATTFSFSVKNGRDGLDGDGAQTAAEVSFDGTVSGMAATWVQGAIDELHDAIAALEAEPAGTDPEAVRDLIGSTLVAGENITITVDDAADTITITGEAGGGSGGGVSRKVMTVLSTGRIVATDGASSSTITTTDGQVVSTLPDFTLTEEMLVDISCPIIYVASVSGAVDLRFQISADGGATWMSLDPYEASIPAGFIAGSKSRPYAASTVNSNFASCPGPWGLVKLPAGTYKLRVYKTGTGAASAASHPGLVTVKGVPTVAIGGGGTLSGLYGWEFDGASVTLGPTASPVTSGGTYSTATVNLQLYRSAMISSVIWDVVGTGTFTLKINGATVATSTNGTFTFTEPRAMAAGTHTMQVVYPSTRTTKYFAGAIFQQEWMALSKWGEATGDYYLPVKITGSPAELKQAVAGGDSSKVVLLEAGQTAADVPPGTPVGAIVFEKG